MTSRQSANVMTRLTWIFGIALFVTSMALTVIAARQSSSGSIMDQLGLPAQQQQNDSSPAIPTYVPPPSTGGDPLTPPAPANGAEATTATPATPAPEAEAIAPPPAADAPAPATAPGDN